MKTIRVLFFLLAAVVSGAADIRKDRATVRTPRFPASRLREVGRVLSGGVRAGWLALPADDFHSAEQRLFKADEPGHHRQCEPWPNRLYGAAGE